MLLCAFALGDREDRRKEGDVRETLVCQEWRDGELRLSIGLTATSPFGI